MINSTPPCASTAKRWGFPQPLVSHAAIKHRSAPICPVDRLGSFDTTSSPFVMRERPRSTPASVGTRESKADQGPTVNRKSASVARILKPFWMVAKLEAMAVLVVSALRSADDHVVRPPGFRSPSCPPPGVRQITKLSALRDSDPQVVRPSGFVRSPLSALRDSDPQVVRPPVSAIVFTCLPSVVRGASSAALAPPPHAHSHACPLGNP